MKRSYRCSILLWFAIAFAVQAWAKDKVEKMVFPFNGKPRTVYWYAPEDPGALPVVVLLHGSGRDGTEMTSAWKSLAGSERFIIAAPNSYNSASWDSQDDHQRFCTPWSIK